MNLNLGVALEKMDQQEEKMKEIKKHQKEPLKLKIFTLEKIVKKKPSTLLKCIEIKKDMGWCNDSRFPKKYNKLLKVEKKLDTKS
jgi:L,D-peptidoglycan transpeptidase YkuD (ErfK/YbiS/YcfS/YnhG family)